MRAFIASAEIPETMRIYGTFSENVQPAAECPHGFGKATGCGVPRPATYNKGPAGTVPVGSIPPCCDWLPRRRAHRRAVSWFRRHAGTRVPGETAGAPPEFAARVRRPHRR